MRMLRLWLELYCLYENNLSKSFKSGIVIYHTTVNMTDIHIHISEHEQESDTSNHTHIILFLILKKYKFYWCCTERNYFLIISFDNYTSQLLDTELGALNAI